MATKRMDISKINAEELDKKLEKLSKAGARKIYQQSTPKKKAKKKKG